MVMMMMTTMVMATTTTTVLIITFVLTLSNGDDDITSKNYNDRIFFYRYARVCTYGKGCLGDHLFFLHQLRSMGNPKWSQEWVIKNMHFCQL